MSAKTLMDMVYKRIEHGDDAHKKWLKEECEKITADLEKSWLVFDPVQKAQVQEGMKLFRNYANNHIALTKIRSGNLELNDSEKEIEPMVRLAYALLQV